MLYKLFPDVREQERFDYVCLSLHLSERFFHLLCFMLRKLYYHEHVLHLILRMMSAGVAKMETWVEKDCDVVTVNVVYE